ncbi:MAG: HD domain-containing protein [Erysipelotrichaceae bacterium]|nr:HD domain-containing protein [Erysipelotrichaceae bacterium]
MIDLAHALKAFTEYVNGFDRTQEAIELKYVHSIEVMKVMKQLANSLKLSDELCDLACLIGLLHDYGRFEQWQTYQSFRDDLTVDHADFSARLLFEEGAIRHFIDDRKYDAVIKEAIIHHNKYAITGEHDELTLLMCQLIRDADKIDNFRVKEVMPVDIILGCSIEDINHQTITPEVYEQFANHQLIVRETRRTQLDMWLSYIAFIFDLNFDQSLDYIQSKNYINRLFSMVDPVDSKVKSQYLTLQQIANDYAYR